MLIGEQVDQVMAEFWREDHKDHYASNPLHEIVRDALMQQQWDVDRARLWIKEFVGLPTSRAERKRRFRIVPSGNDDDRRH